MNVVEVAKTVWNEDWLRLWRFELKSGGMFCWITMVMTNLPPATPFHRRITRSAQIASDHLKYLN